MSFFSGFGGVLGLMCAEFQSDWSFSVSTLYRLPLGSVASMSRKIDRNRVATWSSNRRPNGQVPVVSMSMEQTLGMKISAARLSGIFLPLGFQESSGIRISWNRTFLTRGNASMADDGIL